MRKDVAAAALLAALAAAAAVVATPLVSLAAGSRAIRCHLLWAASERRVVFWPSACFDAVHAAVHTDGEAWAVSADLEGAAVMTVLMAAVCVAALLVGAAAAARGGDGPVLAQVPAVAAGVACLAGFGLLTAAADVHAAVAMEQREGYAQSASIGPAAYLLSTLALLALAACGLPPDIRGRLALEGYRALPSAPTTRQFVPSALAHWFNQPPVV